MDRADICAVVFDKDGTLFDLQATWGAFAGDFLRALAGTDAVLLEVLAEAVGHDLSTGRLREDSVIVAETPEAVADALMPYLPDPGPRSAFIARLNMAALSAPLSEAAPLEPLLSGLVEAGYRLAVVTNDAEAPARAHLEAVGAARHFGMILGYDSGHGAKPGPGQILAVAEAFGLPPDRILMVGDSMHDLLAGRAAGTACAGVLTGTARPQELAPFADVVLPDIGALPGWLDAG